MQQTQKQEQKSGNKKLHTSPSAVNFSNRQRNGAQIIYGPKPGGRVTDHTDDKYSESNSQINLQNGYPQGRVSQQGLQYTVNQSRFSKNTRGQSENMFRVLSQKQQNVIQLRQRLKNIHHFYRIRIEQQRTKNIQRNQIFIAIIEQLQKTHNDKVIILQKTLEQLESDKKQIDLVDERMVSMQGKIEDVIKGSQELKEKNEETEKKILEKQLLIKEKEAQFMAIKDEVTSLRDKLEQFQRLKLKENKRNKQLLEMIQHLA